MFFNHSDICSFVWVINKDFSQQSWKKEVKFQNNLLTENIDTLSECKIIEDIQTWIGKFDIGW